MEKRKHDTCIAGCTHDLHEKKKNKWITVSKTTRNQECFINNIYLACRVDKLQHVFLTVMLYFRCKSFQKKINKRNGSTQAKPALARSIVRILKVVLRHRWMNHTHYSQLLDHRNPRIALPLTGLWSKISLKSEQRPCKSRENHKPGRGF